MGLTKARFFVPGVFLAYAAFATIVAGVAAPAAGMAVLVVGVLAALILDFARWHGDDAGRTTMAAPFRPDPYGLRESRAPRQDGTPKPAAPEPPAPTVETPASP